MEHLKKQKDKVKILQDQQLVIAARVTKRNGALKEQQQTLLREQQELMAKLNK